MGNALGEDVESCSGEGEDGEKEEDEEDEDDDDDDDKKQKKTKGSEGVGGRSQDSELGKSLKTSRRSKKTSGPDLTSEASHNAFHHNNTSCTANQKTASSAITEPTVRARGGGRKKSEPLSTPRGEHRLILRSGV